MRPKVVLAAILVNETVAVTCQFIQHTDPRFPLVYFTVSSAAVAGITAAAGLVAPRLPVLRAMRVTSAVGVVLAAIVFAVFIAPALPAGGWFAPWDDSWVRTATVLMHGTAPFLVVVGIAVAPPGGRLPSWFAVGLSWPLLYLSVIGLGAVFGSLNVPYPFLRPTVVGWPAVVGGVVVLTAMAAGIIPTIFALSRVADRVRQRTTSDTRA